MNNKLYPLHDSHRTGFSIRKMKLDIILMILHILTENIFIATLQSRYGRLYHPYLKDKLNKAEKCGIYT